MDRGSTPVEVYTASHRVIGHVTPGPPGLFNFLNRPTESYFQVEGGEMNLLYKINEQPERCDRLWLVKREVVAVLVGSRAGLGSSSVQRSGYTKPFPHLVRVLAQDFEMQGLIHSGGRFDFGAVMFEGENLFLPMFDAKISALLFPRVQSESPALAFNRAMVLGMSLLPGRGAA